MEIIVGIGLVITLWRLTIPAMYWIRLSLKPAPTGNRCRRGSGGNLVERYINVLEFPSHIWKNIAGDDNQTTPLAHP
jgi:hypothetical protein